MADPVIDESGKMFLTAGKWVLSLSGIDDDGTITIVGASLSAHGNCREYPFVPGEASGLITVRKDGYYPWHFTVWNTCDGAYGGSWSIRPLTPYEPPPDPIPQPDDSSVSSQSDSSPVSPQPDSSPVSPQPDSSPVSPQPDSSPVSPQPDSSPVSPQPDSSPVSPQPDSSPVSPQPDSSPVSPQPDSQSHFSKSSSSSSASPCKDCICMKIRYRCVETGFVGEVEFCDKDETGKDMRVDVACTEPDPGPDPDPGPGPGPGPGPDPGPDPDPNPDPDPDSTLGSEIPGPGGPGGSSSGSSSVSNSDGSSGSSSSNSTGSSSSSDSSNSSSRSSSSDSSSSSSSSSRSSSSSSSSSPYLEDVGIILHYGVCASEDDRTPVDIYVAYIKGDQNVKLRVPDVGYVMVEVTDLKESECWSTWGRRDIYISANDRRIFAWYEYVKGVKSSECLLLDTSLCPNARTHITGKYAIETGVNNPEIDWVNLGDAWASLPESAELYVPNGVDPTIMAGDTMQRKVYPGEQYNVLASINPSLSWRSSVVATAKVIKADDGKWTPTWMPADYGILLEFRMDATQIVDIIDFELLECNQ